jgi:nucleoside 2-deoxyribosyltransferase/ubiquinone/menaquinone biosynthesis C-methylase UbiE
MIDSAHVFKETDIYWANSFFVEADQQFNNQYVNILRSQGYSVFLPQEASLNKGIGDHSPAAREIFVLDTLSIMNSRLVIACIDQETIDSGVATEIGIAYSFGIPIIGLYTDLRQDREGPGRMYKNLYIIGAIEAYGEIVKNSNDLLKAIPRYLDREGVARIGSDNGSSVASHFSNVARSYDKYIQKLESFYEPEWSAKKSVRDFVKSSGAKRILEFGSATGALGKLLDSLGEELFYVGFDESEEMTRLAKEQTMSERMVFTSDWSEVAELSNREPFDIVVSLFTLHDLKDKKAVLGRLSRQVSSSGQILIVDISQGDLPLLTASIRRVLACPAILPDMRLCPIWMSEIALQLNLCLDEYRLHLPKIAFPAAKDIDEFLEMFGIFEGMDLPLGISEANAQEASLVIKSAINDLEYPFIDKRVFSSIVLKKYDDD